MMTELDHKILELVLQADTPISSKRLAAICDVSVNTIRSEIDLLNREAGRHGYCIRMKRSVGVYIDILDEHRAEPYLSHMRDFFVRSRRVKKSYSDRVYYLARQILSSPSGLTVEKLAQTLYVSRGTILQEMKSLRALIAPFGLQLVNRRGGAGLGIEGDEWSIRQFLIHLHKNYHIALQSDKYDPLLHEYGFRAMFFMDDPCYEQIYSMLQADLLAQREFALPVIHFPKLINLLMLCASRKKYLSGQAFDEQQRQIIRSAPEHEFVEHFCRKLPPRFRQAIQEPETDMLTALILSFETENLTLMTSEQGREPLAAVQELIRRFQMYFGMKERLFDNFFVEQTCCTLYRLANQHRFHTVNDPESVTAVQSYGIATANLCLVFARFYAERYGYFLSRTDAMESFFIFNSLLLRTPRQFYAPNVAVVSEFGVGCARAVEERLRLYYGDMLGRVEGLRYSDVLQADADDWDLIITDMSRNKIRRYLSEVKIPILPVELTLRHYDCPEMDIWLDTHKQDLETRILNDSCFCRVHLRSKEEVFDFLNARHREDLQPLGYSAGEELRRNDALIDLERENGMVFLPVLLRDAVAPKITVLLNDTPIPWNRSSAQILVFYIHGRSQKGSKVLSAILRRLLYMPSEVRRALLDGSAASPQLLFYPNE